MSIKAIVSFDVADFAKFRSGFAMGENARTEADIVAEAYRNIDSSNNVWVICTATSKEVFWEFFTSDAQKERMENAGVISAPTITLLED